MKIGEASFNPLSSSAPVPMPNIFTIPARMPFLDCLAHAILNGDLPREGGKPRTPLDLAEITLMLPTRRATRALQDAFLKAGNGRAMLLPKIVPISEGDEDASLVARLSAGADARHLEIPPEMSDLERRLTLTNLVMRWQAAMQSRDEDGRNPTAGSGTGTPAQAANLAAELAALMDMVETEGRALDGLATLVPEGLSEHWQQTLQFLEIVTQFWPAYMAEQGKLSKVGRRNAVLAAEAERLRTSPPKGPVIVAGVTGSIPATVDILRAVASLPNGAIVLPALDTFLDDESWSAIKPPPPPDAAAPPPPRHPEHPQYGLKALLDKIGLHRRDVRVLTRGERPVSPARTVFVSEAMRPARTTAKWAGFASISKAKGDTAIPRGLSLLEAPTAQDEAEAVALILRETLNTPGRTAALVSPDRLLARRVAIRLEAWGIKVDDSAGRPFGKTPPGALLDLLITAVAKGFAPAETMALLKHPLARLGLDPFMIRRAARALEIAVFRAPYLGEGLDGIMKALQKARLDGGETRRHRALRRLWDEDWNGAEDLVTRLANAVSPLTALYASEATTPLSHFAKAHLDAAEALAKTEETTDESTSSLWQGEAGRQGALFFASLIDDKLPVVEITARDYADLYRSLIAKENVRPAGPVHPRLAIWGPFEARLQQPDVVILGSLNEGTWPEAGDPGPWLNRPMREALGLPSPEEKIGQSAHDFATLLEAPEVILTRAEKKDGVPTVPSRWLLRLKALLDGMEAAHALEPASPWLGWARVRNKVDPAPRLAVPEPRPPLEMRPRKLSVSRIETWLGNPYAIFAREILGLEPLDPLGQEPGPALRGSVIHQALSRFAEAHPKALPDDAADRLVRLALDVLQDYAANPRIEAFWVRRFERFAEWFAETEPARRLGVDSIVTETSGELLIAAAGGPFRITARADRIDVKPKGIVITDYKTGKPPTDKDVTTFLSPQLPLEAAIALGASGFTHVPKGAVAELRYISASGGEPPGEERTLKVEDVAMLAAAAIEGLTRHINHFDSVATPYRPLRRQRYKYDYDDFAHLARVAEWSSGASTIEEA